jgi:hypothetical protein
LPVEARGLNEIARECGFGEITYLSIDTEGSELSILRSVDFSALMVHVLTVEFNYEHVKPHMIALMRDRGFDYAQQLGYDLIFINRNSPYRETFARLQGTSLAADHPLAVASASLTVRPHSHRLGAHDIPRRFCFSTSDGCTISYTLQGVRSGRAPRLALIHSLALDRSVWEGVVRAAR